MTEREYPDVCDGTQENATFIPENFFSQCPEVIQEQFTDEQKKERADYMEEIKVEGAKKDDVHYAKHTNENNLKGDQAERSLYDKLKQLFNLKTENGQYVFNSKDIIVLHGLDIQDEGTQQEFDFVVLDASRKLILLIEVKNDYNHNQKNRKDKVKKALKQLNKYQQVGLPFFQFSLSIMIFQNQITG